MPTTKPYTALYARVSSPRRNGRCRQRTDAQRLALRKYAREHHIRNARYLEDHATGRTVKRDNLQRIIEDCRSGRCSHLIIWKMDRLARNCRHTLNLLSDLMSHKVKVSVVAQNIEFDDSPMSNFLIQLFAAIAELESSFVSDRIRAALAVCREKGQQLGAKPQVRKRNRIRRLLDSGYTQSEVARKVGVSRQSVSRMVARMSVGTGES